MDQLLQRDVDKLRAAGKPESYLKSYARGWHQLDSKPINQKKTTTPQQQALFAA
jgi:hypothetical protein